MAHDIWNDSYEVGAFDLTQMLPLTNFAGRNYPGVIDELLVKAVQLREDERVLDIGGGNQPFARADVIAEAYPDDDVHRHGNVVQDRHKVVQAFAEELPFADKEFDFAITRHTFEHLVSPYKACRELMRVAKRGYIETPNIVAECIFGFAGHPWIVGVEEGALVFRRKPWVRSPFRNMMRPFWNADHEIRYAFELTYRNLFNTQFEWAGEFDFRVENADSGLLYYEEPARAAEAHLDLGLNALSFGYVPDAEMINDFEMALRYDNNCALAMNAIGFMHARSGRLDEARTYFERAADADPVEPVYQANLRAAISGVGSVDIVPLPPLVEGSESDFGASVQAAIHYTKGDRILEIGSSKRFPWTTELAAIRPDGSLPVADRAFDAVICLDGIGAVAAIERALAELSRVANRGYLELPTRLNAFAYTSPNDGWYSARENGRLRIHQRGFIESPLKNFMMAMGGFDGHIANLMEFGSRNLMREPIVWHGEISAVVCHVPNAYSPLDADKFARAVHDVEANHRRVGMEPPLTLRAPQTAKSIDGNETFRLSCGAVETNSTTPELTWLPKLLSLLAGGANGKSVRLANVWRTLEPALRHAGFSQAPEGVCDVVIGAMNPSATLSNASDGLADGGLFVTIASPFPDDPEAFRETVEGEFSADVHLLDPESSHDALVAFGWKARRFSVERRVLETLHQNALSMFGGGEFQVFNTLVKAIRNHGVRADVSLSLRLEPANYDLVHVFSLYQPEKAEALARCDRPVVVSPIYWNSSAVRWATVALGTIFGADLDDDGRRKYLDGFKNGTLAVHDLTRNQVRLPEEQLAALRGVRDAASALFPSGQNEAREMDAELDRGSVPHRVVWHGIDPTLYADATPDAFMTHTGLKDFVLCVGRVEPMKNQLMLAYALRDIGLPLVFIGRAFDPSYEQLVHKYACKARFIQHLEPALVASAYAAARAHVLPSFWETPGLVSLEAAVARCPIVVTDHGTVREYVGDHAYYCDPSDLESIRRATLEAIECPAHRREALRAEILSRFTAEHAAAYHREAFDDLIERHQSRLPRDRWLAVPDWEDVATWEPLISDFCARFSADDPVTLLLLVGDATAAEASEAVLRVTPLIERIGASGPNGADIELTDLANVGRATAIIRTGSQLERTLFGDYNVELTSIEEMVPIRASA